MTGENRSCWNGAAPRVLEHKSNTWGILYFNVSR